MRMVSITQVHIRDPGHFLFPGSLEPLLIVIISLITPAHTLTDPVSAWTLVYSINHVRLHFMNGEVNKTSK